MADYEIGGQLLSFPDEMGLDEINAAVDANFDKETLVDNSVVLVPKSLEGDDRTKFLQSKTAKIPSNLPDIKPEGRGKSVVGTLVKSALPMSGIFEVLNPNAFALVEHMGQVSDDTLLRTGTNVQAAAMRSALPDKRYSESDVQRLLKEDQENYNNAQAELESLKTSFRNLPEEQKTEAQQRIDELETYFAQTEAPRNEAGAVIDPVLKANEKEFAEFDQFNYDKKISLEMLKKQYNPEFANSWITPAVEGLTQAGVTIATSLVPYVGVPVAATIAASDASQQVYDQNIAQGKGHDEAQIAADKEAALTFAGTVLFIRGGAEAEKLGFKLLSKGSGFGKTFGTQLATQGAADLSTETLVNVIRAVNNAPEGQKFEAAKAAIIPNVETLSYSLGASAFSSLLAATVGKPIELRKQNEIQPTKQTAEGRTSENRNEQRQHEGVPRSDSESSQPADPETGTEAQLPADPGVSVSSRNPELRFSPKESPDFRISKPEPIREEIISPLIDAPVGEKVGGYIVESNDPEFVTAHKEGDPNKFVIINKSTRETAEEIAEEIVDVKINNSQKSLVQDLATRAKTQIENFGPGAANSSEYQRRYAAVGAEKIVNGTTSKREWMRQMEEEFGDLEWSPEQYNKVWEDSKSLIGSFEDSKVKGSRESLKTTIEAETGVKDRRQSIRERLRNAVDKFSAYKTQLREVESATSKLQRQHNRELREKARETARLLREAKGEKKAELRAQLKDLQDQAKQETARTKVAEKWIQADIDQAGKELIDFINERLPTSERGKFLQRAVEATRPVSVFDKNPQKVFDRTFRVMNEVEVAAEKFAVKKGSKDFKKTAQKGFQNPKVDVQAKKDIKTLSESFEQVKGSLNSDDIASWQTQLDNLIEKGKLDYTNKQAQYRKEVEDAAALIANQTTSNRFDNWKDYLRKMGEIGGRSIITPMNYVFESLDGAVNGFAKLLFKTQFDVVHNAMYQRRDANIKNFLTPLIADLTEDQRKEIGVYMLAKRPDVRERLIASGQFSEEMLDDISKNISQDLKNRADQFQPKFKEIFDEIAPRHEALTNIPLEALEDYVPLYYVGQNPMDNASILGDRISSMYNLKNVPLNRTKERKGVSGRELETDIGRIFEKYNDETSYWIETSDTVKFMADLAVRPEIEKAFGKAGQREILEFVDSAARRGGAKDLQEWKALDWLRKKITAALLVGRLSTTALQILSYVSATGWVKPDSFLWGMKEWANSAQARDWVMRNFPEIRNSVGNDPDYYLFPDKKSLTSKAWKTISIPDQQARMALALAKYHEMHGGRMDYSKAPTPLEVAEIQEIVAKTQSSTEWKDQPKALSRGAFGSRSVSRAVFQFGSFGLAQFANLKNGALQLGIKEKSLSKTVKITAGFLTAQMVEALAREALSSTLDLATGRQRDENFARRSFNRFARQTIETAPLIGKMGTQAYAAYTDSPYLYSRADPIFPTLNVALQGLNSITTAGRIFDGDQTKYKRYDAAISLAELGGVVSGVIGTGQAAQIARDVNRSKNAGEPRRKKKKDEEEEGFTVQ